MKILLVAATKEEMPGFSAGLEALNENARQTGEQRTVRSDRGISKHVEPRNRAASQIGPALAALNRWLADFI